MSAEDGRASVLDRLRGLIKNGGANNASQKASSPSCDTRDPRQGPMSEAEARLDALMKERALRQELIEAEQKKQAELRSLIKQAQVAAKPIQSSSPTLAKAFAQQQQQALKRAQAQQAVFHGHIMEAHIGAAKPAPKVQVNDRAWVNVGAGSKLDALLEHVPLLHLYGDPATYLAGGAIRRWAEGYGQTDGDLDVWCKSANARDAAKTWLKANGWTNVTVADKAKASYLTEWAKEIDGETVTLQLMAKYFEGPGSVISAFDFTINQGAIYRDDEGNLRLMTSTAFDKDVRDRTLRAVTIRSKSHYIKRLVKFTRDGYYVPDDEWPKMLDALEKAPKGKLKADDEEYEDVGQDASYP